MKLAIINPTRFAKNWLIYSNGISALKGSVENKDISVEIFYPKSAIDFYSGGEINENDWPEFESILKDVASFNPNVIGLSIMSDNNKLAKKLIKNIKRKKELKYACIIAGGHMPTAMYERTLLDNRDINYVFIGEAENNLRLFLENGFNHHKTPGIAFLQNGKVVINENESAVDLDKIHYSREYLLSELMRVHKDKKEAFIPLEIQRGCNYSKCTFCDIQHFYRLSNKKPRLVRYRGIDKVVEEIVYWNSKGYFNFALEDDAFGNPNYLIALKNELTNIRAKNTFAITARSDEMARFKPQFEEIFSSEYMHISGVAIGFESGSDEVLQMLNKGTLVSENEEAVEFIRNMDKKHHKTTSIIFNVILFPHPDISLEDVVDNFQFIGRNVLPCDRLFAHYSTVAYPKTTFWRELMGHGYELNEEDGYAIKEYRFNNDDVDYLYRNLKRFIYQSCSPNETILSMAKESMGTTNFVRKLNDLCRVIK